MLNKKEFSVLSYIEANQNEKLTQKELAESLHKSESAVRMWELGKSEPDLQTVDPNEITVAPDTHVCKASLQLGLIDQKEYLSSNVQTVVAERWREVFEGTNHRCIDIHTPLWLWSRAGFPDIFKNPPA